MGRKSKLSPAQWAEVDTRILEGESQRALAREFLVSEASIRERLAKHGRLQGVQEVAAKIVDAERCLAALPLAAQISARTLADRLRSISDSLAGAGRHGAETAHLLSCMANAEVQKVDAADPMKSLPRLQSASALTKLANDAATIPLRLVAVYGMASTLPDPKKAPTINLEGLSDATLVELVNAMGTGVLVP